MPKTKPTSLGDILRQLTKTRQRARAQPAEEKVLRQRLERLPDREYQILFLYKERKRTPDQIAKTMGMDAHSVRTSLAKTFASLLHPDGPNHGDDGEPQPNEIDQPPKQVA